MQGMIEDQEILVRGTPEHKSYLWYKLGWIKAIVNYLEEALSTTGRLMLLSYIVYIAVQAGMESIMHQSTPPLLDIIMLALQVAGLEGSIPGLIHTAEDLADRGKAESALEVRRAAEKAQMLAIMTIVDLFLIAVNHTTIDKAATLDPRLVSSVAGITFCYSWFLLGYRVFVIGKYLISMAHINRRDVRIISQSEVKNQLVQTPDYAQLADSLRAEFGQQLAEIDAKIIQPEPLDYRQIVAQMLPVFGQFTASLQEEMSAQIPVVDYAEIVSHMMPTLNDWRIDIVAKVDGLEAQIPQPLDLSQLATELAPLVTTVNTESKASTLEPSEEQTLEETLEQDTGALNNVTPLHAVPKLSKRRTPAKASTKATGKVMSKADRVRLYLNRNDMTASAIAEKVGVTQGYVSQIKSKMKSEPA